MSKIPFFGSDGTFELDLSSGSRGLSGVSLSGTYLQSGVVYCFYNNGNEDTGSVRAAEWSHRFESVSLTTITQQERRIKRKPPSAPV